MILDKSVNDKVKRQSMILYNSHVIPCFRSNTYVVCRYGNKSIKDVSEKEKK